MHNRKGFREFRKRNGDYRSVYAYRSTSLSCQRCECEGETPKNVPAQTFVTACDHDKSLCRCIFRAIFFVSHGIPMKKNLSNCTIAKMELKRGKISPFSVERPRIALKSIFRLKHNFSSYMLPYPPQNAPRVGYLPDAFRLRSCPL